MINEKMSIQEEFIRGYLKRIDLNELPSDPLKKLTQIHKAHLLNIPFENLSIHASEKIILDYNFLFAKIVLNGRGGFCYELNSLFYKLLCNLGFTAYMISAEVFNDKGEAGPEFDHMAVITEIDGKKYLCDAGFGDSFMEPLEMSINKISEDHGVFYKIEKYRDRYLLSESKVPDEWKPKYSFRLKPRRLAEFYSMCTFHSSSPESHFTRKIICTKALHDGRVTITNDKLILTGPGGKKEIRIPDKQNFCEHLLNYFGIRINIDSIKS